MSIEVISPGRLTTVQDLGRYGYRALGVGCAGALDRYSFEIANRLVGNSPAAAVLEITLGGPRLHFNRAARIAICGAHIGADVEGIEIPGWRPVDLPAGAELRLESCRAGVRAYLEVAGGLDVARVLGSRSTDLRGGFGGLDGRALQAGDRLQFGDSAWPQASAVHVAPWWINPAPDLDFAAVTTVRMLPGRDAQLLHGRSFAAGYRVDPASDRQGLRLRGPSLQVRNSGERISEPVTPGTVQLPPDGQPIVLLADAQTIGGYPRIGHVLRADLPRLAQLRAGDQLRFETVDPEQAQAVACGQRQRLARMALAIEQRLRDR